MNGSGPLVDGTQCGGSNAGLDNDISPVGILWRDRHGGGWLLFVCFTGRRYEKKSVMGGFISYLFRCFTARLAVTSLTLGEVLFCLFSRVRFNDDACASERGCCKVFYASFCGASVMVATIVRVCVISHT